MNVKAKSTRGMQTALTTFFNIFIRMKSTIKNPKKKGCKAKPIMQKTI